MSFTVRLIVASLTVLLAACSSTPPPAPRKVVYRPVVSAPPQFPSPLADDILLRAIGLVGTPYRWGGNTPDSGFDCSGLIGYVYHDAAGITLPRSTREMITLRGPDIDRSQLQTGDLVFFATGGGSHVSHAGIYVGEGRFVHAPATGGTVKLDSLDKPYWQKAWLNAKRVIQPSNLAKQ
jgi:cell wall-associated NlpC family hydrolase